MKSFRVVARTHRACLAGLLSRLPRCLICAALGVTLWCGITAPSVDAAQSDAPGAYPVRPLRIVVPFAPGGNIDMTARAIAPGLSEALGQQVIVDNRGGGGGRVGAAIVAKSPPDGYTILLGADGSLIVPAVFIDNLDYQPLRDFVYTAPISFMPGVLVVHPSMPVRTTRDLIALARARPETLLMASPGNASNGHLTGELFQSMAKVKFVHVPYKGGGTASIDLVSGQVHLGFGPLSTPLTHIRAGKLRAIAVTARKRSAFFPDLPTIDESGVPGFEATTLTVLALPAATPREVVEKVRGALLTVLAQPLVRERFAATGGEVVTSTPEDYVRRTREEYAKLMRIRKETGIRMD